MISSVGSSAGIYAASSLSQPAAAPPKTQTPQDSVQLSSAAKKAIGDVDHDGDSH